MSYVEIFGVYDGATHASSVGKVGNAWIGCMSFWRYLSEKYLGGFDFASLMNDDCPLWNLDKDPRLTPVERLVLLTTFDHIIFHAEMRELLISAFRVQAQILVDAGLHTNLPEQADVLASMETDALRGICWHQHSVSCDRWFSPLDEWYASRGARSNQKYPFWIDESDPRIHGVRDALRCGL